jgi:anthranilate phosphoribosyltransferase
MTESLDIWKQTLAKLTSGRDLETEEIQSVMRDILQGGADTEDIKSFLLSLKAKGETAEEVSALVAEMYRHAGPSISLQLRRSSQPLQALGSSNMVIAQFPRVQGHPTFWKHLALCQVLMERA